MKEDNIKIGFPLTNCLWTTKSEGGSQIPGKQLKLSQHHFPPQL
jgi:hypothetical protein